MADTIEVTATIEVFLRCNECNSDLTGHYSRDNWGDTVVEIDPCPTCFKVIKDERDDLRAELLAVD